MQTLDLILRCYFKICVNHPPTVFSSAVQQQGPMQQVGETVQNTDHAFHSAQSVKKGSTLIAVGRLWKLG